MFHTATAIQFIYSFSGNSAASAPISTFMCLWAIYIFPGLVYIFPPAEQADPSWEYIIRSQTHECGNWDWGLDIPFLGIFVSNFRHFVFAVHDRETREGWSLLTVETEVNEDSRSTNEMVPSLAGSWGLWCRCKRSLFCLGCSRQPNSKIIPHRALFKFMCPHHPAT